ncbi:MAG: hypothetical protein ACI909_002471 [Planctomycetota bacterium]
MNRNRSLLTAVFLVFLITTASAEITSVVIEDIVPVADGKPFGKYGAYEYVWGKVYGSLDPKNLRNQVITNIEHAGTGGVVNFSADFALLRPTDPSVSTRLLAEAPNRGRKYVMQMMNSAIPPVGGARAGPLSPKTTSHPLSLNDAGNGFLMRHGFSLAWVAWENMQIRPSLMRAELPVADGIQGSLSEEFMIGSRTKAVEQTLQLSYPVDQDTHIHVTKFDQANNQWSSVNAGKWQLKNSQSITPIDGRLRFQNGERYRVSYTASNPEVLGAGFAIFRDFVSMLRYSDKTRSLVSNANHLVKSNAPYTSVTGIGFSQPARFLREFLELGMNLDEQNKKVFDGLMVYTAGVGKSLANLEFGTNFRSNTRLQDHSYPEFRPPFADKNFFGNYPTSADRDVLPYVMNVNTSSEYRNKAAGLLHINARGSKDLKAHGKIRNYLLAGTQHNGRPGMSLKKGKCQYLQNPNDPAPVLRSLLISLAEWQEVGKLPPASETPRLENKSLVLPTQVNFPNIPNIKISRLVNAIDRESSNPEYWEYESGYEILIPQVDNDGNEIAGIATPGIAVPLGTHTGWNFYAPPFPENQLCHMYGAYFPFPLARDARIKNGDPRLSLKERYTSIASYRDLYKQAAVDLKDKGFLLQEDVERYVEKSRSINWP